MIEKKDLSMGWWYYKVDNPSKYTIVFVMRNQLSKEDEWLIWFTDLEGALVLSELKIKNLIKKVPEPF